MNINRTKADSTIQDYQSRVATLTKRCGLEINDENYYKKLVEQLLSEKRAQSCCLEKLLTSRRYR